MAPSGERQAHELRRLLQRLFRRFGALASDSTPCGKPLPLAHAHALMVLLASGELGQQELGRELCIDKSNVARLCAKMVAAGHVQQAPGSDDGRSRRVSLTARGRRVAAEVDGASSARFRALLAGISPALRPAVLVALESLLDSVEALPRANGARERTIG